jgi:hypothetical protein
MLKNLAFILGIMGAVSAVQGTALAQSYESQNSSYSEVRGRNNQFENRNRSRDNGAQASRQDGFGSSAGSSSGSMNGDQAIISAVNGRRDVNFVQGSGMTVIQNLPEDDKGLRHQKFVVQLSNGSKMLAVYNLDMGNCQKIPLQVGDKVAMGGEFKWTSQGALLHWLHYDPEHRRPDGFVQLNGVDYCRSPGRM